MRIHIHIYLHFMNWWEQWAFNKVILKLFICVNFLSHWQEKLRNGSNHIQIRASLVGKMQRINFYKYFFHYPATSKQSLIFLCLDKDQMKPFSETWERFKVMLRKCPNHGFEDIAQLSIFHNSLRPDTKKI